MATKEEMSSLDLRFLVKELADGLANGVFRKIYQYGKKQFLFQIFVAGRGEMWLYADKSRVFLTEYKTEAPPQPPSFCMFLRKHLAGARIKYIKQHEFDRVLEIHTETNVLIFELFSDGNVILCDSSYRIIMPLEIQEWRERQIRPKIGYKHPPRVEDPFATDFGDFVKTLNRSDKRIIVFLATHYGLGQAYAKEVCFRAGVDEQIQCDKINMSLATKVYNSIQSLSKLKSPVIYDDFVSPFPLETFKSRSHKNSQFFFTALDEFFSNILAQAAKEEEEKKGKEEKARTERIVEQQKQAEKKWKTVVEEKKEKPNIIYKNYSLVEGILEGINRARKSGMSWQEIRERADKEDTAEASAIKEIREHEGVVVVKLEHGLVELDIRKSVEENASDYFESMKTAKKKIERIQETRVKTENKQLQDVGGSGKQKETLKERPGMIEKNNRRTQTHEKKIMQGPVIKKRARKKWFEKFRWFMSSDGFLVVAGRDAKQNEMLMKKNTDPADLVFHADIHGAAFVVIKTEGRRAGAAAVKEASEFAAANSKAWSRGLGGVDVYSFTPEQASKTPPTGQSVGTGGFVITGKKTLFKDVEIKLSVGFKIDRESGLASVVSGPVFAVRKNSDYFVTIKPGSKKSYELAGDIKNNILIKARPWDKPFLEKVMIDEIQSALPSGMGDVVG